MIANQLFDALRSLDLPEGDYAVFGSGPLAIRGLIDDPADLDVICKAGAWRIVKGMGAEEPLHDGSSVISLHGSSLTFGRSWAYGNFDIDDLVATAELIDGLPFVLLEHVVAYKQIRMNDRDRVHLALMEEAGLA